MPLQVTNRIFKDDQGRELPFLMGQSLDFLTVTYRVDPILKVTFSPMIQVVKSGNLFTLTSGKWEDYGFIAGASVDFTFGTNSGTGTVNFVDNATISISGTSVADNTYSSGFCKSNSEIEGFKVFFNLVKQSEAGNQQSLIDSEPTRFQIDGLQTLGQGLPANFTQLTNRSGMGEITASIEKYSKEPGTGDSRESFDISFRFPISPWLDIEPFLSDECVKPWVKLEALPQFANPNVKVSTINSNLANTGFVNESFNGGLTAYTKDYIIWKDAATNNIIPRLDYSKACKFEIKILGIFTSNSKYQFKLFFENNNQNEYSSLPTNHNQNTIATVNKTAISVTATPFSFDSAIHPSGAMFTIGELTCEQTATYIKLTGTFLPNTSLVSHIGNRASDNRKYRLWIRCENPAFDYNSSNAMNLDIDSQNSEISKTPLGEFVMSSNRLFCHDGVMIGADDTIFIEDDLRRQYSFKVPKNSILNYAKLGVIVKNSQTGEFFELESKLLDFNAFPTLSDGTKPININESRGYKIFCENQGFYNYTAERAAGLDSSTEYGLQINFPFLVRWEYWLQQLNADNDFWGNENKNWFNYLGVPNWEIFTRLELNFDEGSYFNDNQLIFKNYSQGLAQTVITLERLDGTALTGILDSELIVIKAVHTNNGQTISPESWAEITVEPFENAPRFHLSNVFDFENDNSWIIKPLSGESRLTLVIDNVAHTATCKCLLDPSKLPNIEKVKITSRVKFR